MNEIMQNLPNDKNGFVRELTARQVLLYLNKKNNTGRGVSLDISAEIIKQAVRNADNLWEALYKFHP